MVKYLNFRYFSFALIYFLLEKNTNYILNSTFNTYNLFGSMHSKSSADYIHTFFLLQLLFHCFSDLELFWVSIICDQSLVIHSKNTIVLEQVHCFLIKFLLFSLLRIEHIKHLQCQVYKSLMKNMKICVLQSNKTPNFILYLYSLASNYLNLSLCVNNKCPNLHQVPKLHSKSFPSKSDLKIKLPQNYQPGKLTI